MAKITKDQQRLAKQLLRQKAARRKALAALPIEEKIKILLDLQRLGNDIRRKTGRKPLPEWRQ